MNRRRLPQILAGGFAVLAVLLLLMQQWQRPGASDLSPTSPQPARPALTQTQWPIFRGNSRLAGEAGVPVARLRLRWSVKHSGGFKASPVTAGDAVYIGAEDGGLHALRLVDGAPLWSVRLGAGIEAPTLVSGEALYVGDRSGVFRALSRSDGRELWAFRTGAQITGSANVLQLPPASGAPDGMSAVVFGSHDTHLYALHAKDGALLWKRKTGSYINGAPAVQGGRVVAGGCDHVLRVFRGATGEEQRTIDVGSYLAGSVALDGDRAYFGHYGNEVLCADLAGGSVLWRYADATDAAPFFASAALTDDAVLIGGRSRFLYCLNRADGTLRWRFKAEGELDSSPVACADAVLVCGMDGRVYVVNLADGRLRTRYDVGAPVSASPAIAGGSALVAAEDGRLLCFELLP